MYHHIGQPEQVCQGCVLVTCLHHPHMGHEFPVHIKGRKLDAVSVAAHVLHQRMGNAPVLLPVGIAGKNTV